MENYHESEQLPSDFEKLTPKEEIFFWFAFLLIIGILMTLGFFLVKNILYFGVSKYLLPIFIGVLSYRLALFCAKHITPQQSTKGVVCAFLFVFFLIAIICCMVCEAMVILNA